MRRIKVRLIKGVNQSRQRNITVLVRSGPGNILPRRRRLPPMGSPLSDDSSKWEIQLYQGFCFQRRAEVMINR